MFEINYRIIVEEDYWSALSLEQIEHEGFLEGFFELRFQKELYGYYHDRELREGEEGSDLISVWLEHLLEVYICIQRGEEYVAVSDIESYNTWIEFISKGEYLFVSEVQTEASKHEFVVTTPPEGRNYPEWKDISITKEEFKEELMCKTRSFIQDAVSINKLMLQSQIIQDLQKLLNDVQQSNNQ